MTQRDSTDASLERSLVGDSEEHARMPALPMPWMRRPFAAFLVGLFTSWPAVAADPVTPNLTQKLDRLLREEMRSVQAAMGRIHTAMVMGDHESVAENAQRIHDSFILQRSLTEQDREDLMTAVPPGFIELDRSFHRLSAQLAEAGRTGDTAVEFQVYNRMTRTCLQCHARYVSDRFPGVQPMGRPK